MNKEKNATCIKGTMVHCYIHGSDVWGTKFPLSFTLVMYLCPCLRSLASTMLVLSILLDWGAFCPPVDIYSCTVCTWRPPH